MKCTSIVAYEKKECIEESKEGREISGNGGESGLAIDEVDENGDEAP